MATIANLAVSLTARIGNFQKGFSKARKTVGKFTSDLARHAKTVARYGAALASVAAGAIGFMVKRQFDFIDATTKTAEKLGLTTEALTGLQHAAELTGVPITQLEMGIQRMTRRVAEAGQGLGEAKDALKTLGLDAQQLASMSPDRQFLAIADAMENVGNQSERARLGFKLFDSEGVALINVMRGGSEAVKEYMENAKELGLTFDQIEANKIERANDAITRMKAVITGAARTLSIQLAPFVVAVADKLRMMGTQGEGMGQAVTNAFNWVLRAVGKLADWFELIKAGFFGIQSVAFHSIGVIITNFGLLGKAIQKVLNLLPGVETSFGDRLIQSAEDFKTKGVDAFESATKAYDKFASGAHSKKAQATFEKIKAAADGVVMSTASIGDNLSGAMKEASQSAKTAQFKQIDLSRVAIGGVSGSPSDKPTSKKQGDTMIQRLTDIARNTAKPQALVT